MHGLRYLVGALVLVTSIDAHAKCAMMATVASPLTAANSTVGPTGGVLVGLTYEGREGGTATVDQKGWRFEQGGKLESPTIRLLAPSLAVYQFAGDGATLVNDKRKALVTVRRGKEPAALTAPKLLAATGSLDDEMEWGLSARLSVKLGSSPPPSALGLIVYVDAKPVNWVLLAPKVITVELSSGGHCSNDLPGTSVPTFGSITIAWFDGTGRVSAPSAAIAIRKR